MTFCYRCHRIFGPGETFERIMVDGKLLPVCRDDRACIVWKSRRKRNCKPVRRVKELAARFHDFDDKE